MSEITLNLKVWRQKDQFSPGKMVPYTLKGVVEDMSFLEMLDILNEQIIKEGHDPIAFDSDCREGICGSCGLVINGVPHGPKPATTTCQLFMRHFKNGDTVTIEPWRAKAFPVMKDLVVDRSAFDEIMMVGGFISVSAGSAPDANGLPVGKDKADRAFDAATCIGCGACVAACKNASASLFVGAKITQLALLPQGQPERAKRVVAMVEKMEEKGFGGCSNEGECEAVCPKEISTSHISKLIREYMVAQVKGL